MLKPLAWILAMVIVAACIAEFWAREHFPDGSPWPSPQAISLPAELIEAHPTLGYRFKPNANAFFSGPNDEFDVNYQINEYGLRDSGMFSSGPKQPLVLVLGDSYAEGYGVMRDATFTLEMQRQLRFQRGATIYPRILNAGTSGYGAIQSVDRGKRLIEELKPEIVIFTYTGLMPVADEWHENDAKSIVLTDVSDRKTDTSSGLQVVQLIRDYLRARESRAAIEIGAPDTDLFAAARPGAAAPKLHQQSLQQIVSLAEFAAEREAKFLLLHIPLPHQVANDEWSTGRTAFGFGDEIYEPPESDLLAQLCETTIPDCVLATAAFRKLASERSSRLFFPTSYAMTEVGHRAIVDLLIGYVRNALNIPAPQ